MPPPPASAVSAVAQRLHPAVLGVWALGGIRPLILLLVAGSLNLYFALIFVIVSAVGAAARWYRFEWRLESDALVIEQGVLQRQRRVIPLERIQSVEAVRRVAHRIFGVVELRVESIGGGTTEGQLDALDPRIAESLRTQLLKKGASAADPERERPQEAAPPLVRMRPGRLVVAGITGGRVGVFAAILGFASQALGERFTDVITWLTEFVVGTETESVVAVVLVVSVSALLIAFVLSVVATTFTFWNFTLTRDDRNLYTSRGLLDQRSGTIPLHRVQSVRIEENVARRPLGLAAVKVEVAGHAAGGDGQETSVALPLGTRADALDLVATILDRNDVPSVSLSAMPTGARDRRFVRAAAATLVPTVAAVLWFEATGLAALALALPFTLLALASYRALGHAEPDGLLLARSGVLVRTTHFTRERSLQAVSVTSTPFQRRRDLATLNLHIARSPGGGGDPAIIDVPDQWAHAELLRLATGSDRAARRIPAEAGPTVRLEEDRDAAAVRSLHEAAREDETASPIELGVHDRAPDGRISLVLDDDGKIIGHAVLTTPRTPAGTDERTDGGKVQVLSELAISPERREQGLESRLVKAALTAAAREGTHRVVTAGAPELLESLGFEPLDDRGTAAADSPNGWRVRVLPGDDGSAAGWMPPPVSHPGD